MRDGRPAVPHLGLRGAKRSTFSAKGGVDTPAGTMADSVQYALDRMVGDLEDLRYRGIFSEVRVRDEQRPLNGYDLLRECRATRQLLCCNVFR